MLSIKRTINDLMVEPMLDVREDPISKKRMLELLNLNTSDRNLIALIAAEIAKWQNEKEKGNLS